MQEDKKENAKKKKLIENAVIEGSAAKIVQGHGAAIKEHIVAYSGVDNETSKTLSKSLSSISKENVNPEYSQQNIHQQAGFSAEVKETANVNAENIINGKKIRKVRTDDLGKVNDPKFDHVYVDENGHVIAGSGSQMKFIGTPGRALDKLMSQKSEKYIDNKIDVPSDQYDAILHEIDIRRGKLRQQIDHARSKGNTDLAKAQKQELAKLGKIEKNLRKCTVSSKDAVFAREHPLLSTLQSEARISHRAGVSVAQNAIMIGGTISLAQNLVAWCRGDIDGEEALTNIATDTVVNGATGYAAGFAGSAVKGLMQNASNASIRSLSKTNLPATLVTCTVEVAKALSRYINGEIDGVECFIELGERGANMIGSAVFAGVGQALIPIPVVGAIIGSMVGYAMSTACYGVLVDALNKEKIAKTRRLAIEKECEEHIKLIQKYRQDLEANINKYLSEHRTIFFDALGTLQCAFNTGDVDGVILGANKISTVLGRNVQFNNFEGFDNFMNSNEALRF